MSTRRKVARESWTRLAGYVPEIGRLGFLTVWAALVVVTGLGLFAAGAWLARRFPYGGLGAQAACVAWTAAWAYGGFWRGRAEYRARYGENAYRILWLRFVGPALAGVFAASLMPLAAVSGPRLPRPLSLSLAAYLFATAQLVTVRGGDLFWTFDLRAFVYSVFPERGAWVSSPLFRRLRHPIYSAAVRWILGLAVVRGNAEAVGCGLMLAAAFWLWSRAEENDMIARYPHYRDYMRSVPALFVVSPRGYVDFARYLLTGRDVPPGGRWSAPPPPVASRRPSR